MHLQALDVVKLKPGQRVLIQAGTGGVGHVAIQLAKHAGVHVTTTTSGPNAAFAKVRSCLPALALHLALPFSSFALPDSHPGHQKLAAYSDHAGRPLQCHHHQASHS